jgi:hypothetical protein
MAYPTSDQLKEWAHACELDVTIYSLRDQRICALSGGPFAMERFLRFVYDAGFAAGRAQRNNAANK